MAGWFEAFANFARSGAQGLDRYQQLRQMDKENQFKIHQQKLADQKALMDQQQSQRQMELLDLGILGKKQEQYIGLHDPGQDLLPDDIQQAQQIGLGGRIDSAPKPFGTMYSDPTGKPVADMPNADSALRAAQGDYRISLPGVEATYNQHATPSWLGTPEQQDQEKQKQLMQRALMGADANDPTSLIQIYAASGGKLDPSKMRAPVAPYHAPVQVQKPGGKQGENLWMDPIQAMSTGAQAGHNPPPVVRPTAGSQMETDRKFNAEQTAEGVLTGMLPPTMLGGMSYTADKAALLGAMGKMQKEDPRFKDTNASKLLLEWGAVQKAVSSLQSPQQVRLRQAIDKAIPSLDLVDQRSDELNEILKRTSSKTLNKIEMMAAKEGAYGNEARDAAILLEQQIADVTGEIGQVIMGGYAPTDHGLELAAKNLDSNWAHETLKKATSQARRNLNFASTAILNTTTVGVPSNPYNEAIGMGVGINQAPPNGGAGMVQMLDPNGNPFQAKASDVQWYESKGAKVIK